MVGIPVGWCRAGRSSLAASVVAAPRTTDLSPVRLRLAVLAPPLQRQRRMLPCAATGATERPQLLSRPLVVMDQVVELKRVNLPGVHPREPIADVLEQQTQLVPLRRALSGKWAVEDSNLQPWD